jgi:hypothetical protein
MTDKSHRPFFIAIAAGIALIGGLVALGLRLEGRLGTIENQVLERAPSAEPLQKIPGGPEQVAIGQTVYVSVYSHIYHQGGRELPLEATLSIRNTDPENRIVIQSVRYYDTGGQLIKDYIESPAVLAPLASADFLVERRDAAGGVGANFLVDWVSEGLVNEPVIEAVMVGTEGNKAFSFISSGHPIATEPDDA